MNLKIYQRAMLLFVALIVAQAYGQSAGEAWLIDVEGAIGPATADHMVRSLAAAEDAGAPLVVLRIDTPGGLDSAMRDMVQAVLGAAIPVVGFVAPSGARAASAGTYLLYACHVAAMAPGTNLGAATPVQIGSPGLPGMPGDEEAKGKEGEEGAGPGAAATPMERKIVNDAAAYIESLAQLRGRNAEWAVKAVREGASLAAEKALALHVIDLVVSSEEELLQAVDGRQVSLRGGSHTIASDGLALYRHPVDWRSEFLAVITDPNIAYILMLLGIYGLIIEFYNPGIGLPGVVGAVSLLLAMYAFQVLPISYVGLALMLLGIGLMTAEAFAPSFGILGLGGIVAFVVGSIMLMDTDLPGYQIALPMILAFAAFSAGLLAFALGLLLRARKSALVSGVEPLLGREAAVEALRGDHAMVRLDGELWQAECREPLAADDRVTVDAIDGLTLKVSKVPGENQ